MSPRQEMGEAGLKPCLPDIKFPFHGFVSLDPNSHAVLVVNQGLMRTALLYRIAKVISSVGFS